MAVVEDDCEATISRLERGTPSTGHYIARCACSWDSPVGASVEDALRAARAHTPNIDKELWFDDGSSPVLLSEYVKELELIRSRRVVIETSWRRVFKNGAIHFVAVVAVFALVGGVTLLGSEAEFDPEMVVIAAVFGAACFVFELLRHALVGARSVEFVGGRVTVRRSFDRVDDFLFGEVRRIKRVDVSRLPINYLKIVLDDRSIRISTSAFAEKDVEKLQRLLAARAGQSVTRVNL